MDNVNDNPNKGGRPKTGLPAKVVFSARVLPEMIPALKAFVASGSVPMTGSVTRENMAKQQEAFEASKPKPQAPHMNYAKAGPCSGCAKLQAEISRLNRMAAKAVDETLVVIAERDELLVRLDKCARSTDNAKTGYWINKYDELAKLHGLGKSEHDQT